MRVAELMHTNVVTISPDSSIGELVQSLADARVSGLPVVDSPGRVIGVVSATDVLQAAAEKGGTPARSTITDDWLASFRRLTSRTRLVQVVCGPAGIGSDGLLFRARPAHPKLR